MTNLSVRHLTSPRQQNGKNLLSHFVDRERACRGAIKIQFSQSIHRLLGNESCLDLVKALLILGYGSGNLEDTDHGAGVISRKLRVATADQSSPGYCCLYFSYIVVKVSRALVVWFIRLSLYLASMGIPQIFYSIFVSILFSSIDL